MALGGARGWAPPRLRQALTRSVGFSPVEAGASSPIEIGLRLLMNTATTTTAAATKAMVTRSGVLASLPMLQLTTAGAISSDTRFITLSSGLIAGRGELEHRQGR